MKKILKSTLFALLLIVGSTNVYAGPGTAGHTHGGSTHTHKKISEEKAIKVAKSMKDGLIKKGTIKDNWKDINYSNIVKKKFGKNDEWVITFNNSQIQDKSKQTLYIFVNLYGKVTGVNYTGN